MEDNSRIVIDPNVCGGKPCVHGTRIMVTSLLGMFAGGYTVKRILHAYPELVQEDISAALEYAGRVTEMQVVKHPYQKGIKAQPGIEF